MKTTNTSRKSNNKYSSKVAEFLNSMLLMKSNEYDLYDSFFSNLDTSIFSEQNDTELIQNDKRRNKRIEIPLNVIVEDVQKKVYSMDLIMNLSTTGAKIVSNNSLTKRDKIDMHILFPDAEDTFDIQGTIVWSKEEKGKNTEYGIEFDNTMQKINKVFDISDNLKIPSSSIF